MEEHLRLFLGVLASLCASSVDALGLNIQRRDHLMAARALKPRHECLRWQWHLGLYLYLGSQLIGTTIVLGLLQAQLAAPLSALSLVFNFIFAKILVGTRVTRRDLVGTFIVLGAIITIITTSMAAVSADQRDQENNITPDYLADRIIRPLPLAYFGLLNGVFLAMFGLCVYCERAMERQDTATDAPTVLSALNRSLLAQRIGLCISGVGGALAAETLLLAKCGTGLVATASKQGYSLIQPTVIIVTLLLIVTALLQLSDSVVVVPVFACTYNVFGQANAMVFFDTFHLYPWWAHTTSLLGLLLLVVGIITLAYQDKAPAFEIPGHAAHTRRVVGHGLGNQSKLDAMASVPSLTGIPGTPEDPVAPIEVLYLFPQRKPATE